ncbi:prepilin-type N-terminal cleavage/methylation domain-containing protein [Vibrio coralliilyticus]|uniref:prepilin-type N-terminal cleavage/methylation domain-containing protein n=1 Tax=Vibrio coralliilyticus TaxID=190893 RepID=UPI000BAC13E2|nr:prepilin-type N-terminal cleavage/methylation domain-containing protein [Vibrio coralliilyticus]NOI78470.1 prepilin-type N-terminal cleavage/methylation domain-containing protein [Vibrio coralliilyticus]PAW01169.1 MSHA biogenesis protein MshD [Vibrio coralliilyticus]
MRTRQVAKYNGFSLLEMVIVIVIIGIAISGVSIALFPKGKQSADQVSSVKAAELGRAVLDEVLGRNFDQNSGPNGGLPECVLVAQTGRELCTSVVELGPETDAGENNKTLYNDVDDFDGLNGVVQDVLGEDLSDDYQGYNVSITVFYEQDVSGTMQGTESSTMTNYKRITVTITDRQGNTYPFAATKGNF